MVKMKDTAHGAVKMGLGQAKLGAIGSGKASGTVNSVDTMGTGRAFNPGGGMSPVKSNVKAARSFNSGNPGPAGKSTKKNKMC